MYKNQCNMMNLGKLLFIGLTAFFVSCTSNDDLIIDGNKKTSEVNTFTKESSKVAFSNGTSMSFNTRSVNYLWKN